MNTLKIKVPFAFPTLKNIFFNTKNVNAFPKNELAANRTPDELKALREEEEFNRYYTMRTRW